MSAYWLSVGRVTPRPLLTLMVTSSLTLFSAFVLSAYPSRIAPSQAALAAESSADQVFQEGQVLLGTDQTQTALARLQQALQLYRQDGNRQGEATVLNGMGDAQYSLKQYPAAMESYSRARDIYQQLGDRKGEATALNNIGAVYDNLKQYSDALRLYDEALQLRRDVKDLAGEGTTLNNLAGVYLNLGNYDRALKEYNAALKARWLISDRKGEATTLNNIGFVCRSTAQYHQNRGDLETSQEWYQSALNHYQSALAIRRMVKDRLGEATTLTNLGYVYRTLAQYPYAQDSGTRLASLQEAQRIYLSAAEIYGQLGDRRGEATVLNNLGGVYFSQDQYANALKTYEKALTVVKLTGDQAEQATTLSNIAFIYRTQADTQTNQRSAPAARDMAAQTRDSQYLKALDYYQQALVMIRQVGDRKSEGATLNNIGGINISLGRYSEALNAYQAALAVYEKLGDLPGQGTTRYNIGVTYARQENYREALNSYKQAQSIYEKLSNGSVTDKSLRARRDEIRNVIQAIENRQKAI